MKKDFEKNIEKYINEVGISELTTIIKLSDKNTHFSWGDLDDNSLSVKAWGLAIEYGIIEEVNKRQYEIADKERIKSFVNMDDGESHEDIQEESHEDIQEESHEDDKNSKEQLPEINLSNAKWDTKDKIFGLLGLLGVISYAIEPLREGVYVVLNIPLQYLTHLFPFYMVILILASLTSIWAIIVQQKIYTTSTKDMLKHIKYLTKDSDKKFGLPDDATEEEENELMALQAAIMKSQIKPFGAILSATIPVLIWLSVTVNVIGVGETAKFPILGESAWSSSLIGPISAWLFWYILTSLISSQLFKKLQKLF